VSAKTIVVALGIHLMGKRFFIVAVCVYMDVVDFEMTEVVDVLK